MNSLTVLAGWALVTCICYLAYMTKTKTKKITARFPQMRGEHDADKHQA
ncbi:hypothetical protein [Tumebacillus flagellatus]|nr:hypothetical protein [Tumebacillus flagellatus]